MTYDPLRARDQKTAITATLSVRNGASAIEFYKAAFGADDLVALAERFGAGRLRAHDLVRIIAAGLRGAGETVSDADVSRMTTQDGAAGFARIAAELIAATFGGDEASGATPRPFGVPSGHD